MRVGVPIRVRVQLRVRVRIESESEVELAFEFKLEFRVHGRAPGRMVSEFPQESLRMLSETPGRTLKTPWRDRPEALRRNLGIGHLWELWRPKKTTLCKKSIITVP